MLLLTWHADVACNESPSSIITHYHSIWTVHLLLFNSPRPPFNSPCSPCSPPTSPDPLVPLHLQQLHIHAVEDEGRHDVRDDEDGEHVERDEVAPVMCYGISWIDSRCCSLLLVAVCRCSDHVIRVTSFGRWEVVPSRRAHHRGVGGTVSTATTVTAVLASARRTRRRREKVAESFTAQRTVRPRLRATPRRRRRRRARRRCQRRAGARRSKSPSPRHRSSGRTWLVGYR